MTKIKIAYRQVIDIKSSNEFEKNVFNDSFAEFYLQAQDYNPNRQFQTLTEMIEHNPKAKSLHYKVGFSIGLYVQALSKIIPGLYDTIGKTVPFDEFEFEILHSDVTNKSLHKISLTYLSPVLELFALNGGYIIAGVDAAKETSTINRLVPTLTIPLQQNLSIVAWDSSQEVKHELTYENKV
jgi:hypothetical protein